MAIDCLECGKRDVGPRHACGQDKIDKLVDAIELLVAQMTTDRAIKSFGQCDWCSGPATGDADFVLSCGPCARERGTKFNPSTRISERAVAEWQRAQDVLARGVR